MELHIWGGDWGLHSIDAKCLTVLAFCKFADHTVSVVKAGSINSSRWKTGDLPCLIENGKTIKGMNDIMQYLRSKNFGLDHHLSASQSADILAYLTLLQSTFVPALNYIFWVEPTNYGMITRPAYGGLLKFPTSLFTPFIMQKKYQNQFSYYNGGNQLEEQAKIRLVFKNAKVCLNQLEAKLGQNTYFQGAVPTSLDALIYGHLAPLLKAPLKSCDLQAHLKECPKLVNFITNISNTFFKLSPEELIIEKEKEKIKIQRNEEKSDFPNSSRNIALFAALVFTSMFTYSFKSGLVNLTLKKNKKRFL